MRPRNFTDDEAIPFIRDRTITTIAAILRALNVPHTGPAYQMIWRIVDRYDLDVSHWIGQAHAAGKPAPTRKPISEVLVLNGPLLSSHYIRLRLIREGLKEHRCERCTLTEWQGVLIPLDLHHVNGNKRDNRYENLQLLCPNCHALTPNYCVKNRRMVNLEQQTGDSQKI